MKSNTFIIAEAGVNHNGSEKLAVELVQAAAEAGADAVKFQTFRAENLVLQGASTAEYQKRNSGDSDQFSMLKKLELSFEAHERVFHECAKAGIEFMSTPFDMEAARFLVKLGMETIKIPSGELTNLQFIRDLCVFDKKIILSTGMSTIEEVLEAVDVVCSARQEFGYQGPLESCLTLLHCTSNYPARVEDVNLKAMATMASSTGLPVGYSDHTEGILVAGCAVALGASVIEKHFTLDRDLPGPDHLASLEVGELREMIGQIRQIESSLGDGVKQPRDSELEVRDLVRRSVTLAVAKRAGEAVLAEDLTLLRPGTGIAPREFDNVIGRRVKHDMPAGALVAWQDLE